LGGDKLKVCKDCREEKPLSEFYSYEKVKKKTGEKYTYYYPYCKECTVKRSEKWQEKNPEQYKENCRSRDEISNKKPEKIKMMRQAAKIQRERGDQKKWRQEHPEKLKEYNYKHMHKVHEISDEEWIACKSYFDNTCAYCGIDEETAKEEQGHSLHMEHAINNGANDLSNCIPSCRYCNSQKWMRDFDEWYTKENDKFDLERYNKIIQWLDDDYKLYKN
jgi:hypothetical protein